MFRLNLCLNSCFVKNENCYCMTTRAFYQLNYCNNNKMIHETIFHLSDFNFCLWGVEEEIYNLICVHSEQINILLNAVQINRENFLSFSRLKFVVNTKISFHYIIIKPSEIYFNLTRILPVLSSAYMQFWFYLSRVSYLLCSFYL